jgi:hypothetical protein
MKKDKREELRRARHQDQIRRRLEKKKKLDVEQDELPVEDDAEVLDALATETYDEIEVKEKMYAGESPSMAMMSFGPTSFDELEAVREANEKAHHVEELSWDTQDLVRNIVGNPMMQPKEKAKAIQEVGAGFGARVSKMMGEEKMEKDLDELELSALLAWDKRHTSFVENVGDILKRKLSGAARENLADEDFALVMEQDGKKERKYPVHDKAHVRSALARAEQMMKAGGEGAAEAKKALPRIRAAAKKFGMEATMEKEQNAVVIEKDAKGNWRWVGWATNKYIDWDGDIIAESAHKEYLEWLDKNRDMAPVHLMWHTPGTARENPVDFWMYENGFVILSGILTEKEAQTALKARALTDMGMSIGALALERDEKDPRIILKYRMYEVSDLPLENAANPWTDVETLIKEVGMDKYKYFAELLGSEEKATEYVRRTGLKKDALDEAQVESKEKTPESHVKIEEPAEVPIAAAASQMDMKAIVEAVVKETGMEELSKQFAVIFEAAEKVPMLEQLVKDLSRDGDDKLAEILTPPASRFAWMSKQAASKSTDNKVDETKPADKVLKSLSPHWLSDATGTAPVQAQ